MNTLRELLQYIKNNNKKIICFGTGVMGAEALEYPEIHDNVVCFCDNDEQKQGKEVLVGKEAYKVIAPKQLENYINPSNEYIVLITSGHFRSIEKQLPSGIEYYIYPILKVQLDPKSEDFFEERILKECMKEYDMLLEQYHIAGEEHTKKRNEKETWIRGDAKKNNRPFVIPRIMIMPTTRCNLRCKGCSSLLPLFEHPQDIDVDHIKRDGRLFFSGIDECIRLTVGGEPFFYPQLQELLEYLLEEPKLLSIMMITNGMMLPKPELVPLLQNPKVFIEISDYGRLEQMSKAIAFFEKNKINFKVLTEQVWTDMGGVECRNRTPEELRFVYMNCDQGRVIKGMHNGKFHSCARSARMLTLGVYESKKDYFELLEEDSPEVIRAKLMDMYYSDSADSCNYCDLGALPTKVMEAGIQMNEQIIKSNFTIVDRKEYEELKRLAQVKS